MTGVDSKGRSVRRAMVRATVATGLAVATITLSPGPVSVAVFAVTTTVDGADGNPGDGICSAGPVGCTLRAAIQEANAVPGADTVTAPSRDLRADDRRCGRGRGRDRRPRRHRR